MIFVIFYVLSEEITSIHRGIAGAWTGVHKKVGGGGLRNTVIV